MPNPQRSSACDCTCVLTRIDHCLVTLSCLPCACLCKVHSRISDALSRALCNLSLAFLADFTLSDSTALNFYAGGFLHADNIRTLATIIDSLNDQVALVEKFAESNFLKLKVQKCEVVVFYSSGKEWRMVEVMGHSS